MFLPPPSSKSDIEYVSMVNYRRLQLEMLARGGADGVNRCRKTANQKAESGLISWENALARPLWATFDMMSLWLLVTGPCGTINVNEL